MYSADAEVSEDLLHILIAIHECSDKNRLKAALATPLLRAFAFEFDELDRLENNDNDLEALIEEFSAYRQLWLQHGISDCPEPYAGSTGFIRGDRHTSGQ